MMHWMLVAMVFLYPVWPVFIEKKIGPLPSLTPQKILTYALVGLCLLQIVFSRQYYARLRLRLSCNLDIVTPLGMLLALKLLSCLLSAAPVLSLNLFYYETLTTVGVLFVTIAIIKDRSQLALIFTALVAATLFIGAFTVVEAIAGKNILEPFIPAETGLLALIDKAREGARRLQGTFASPLVLAEFASMMIPIALLATPFPAGRGRNLISLGLVALMLAAIYGSRTRSALGFILLAAGIWSFRMLRAYISNPKKNSVLRAFVWFYGGVALIAAAALGCYLIYSMATGFSIGQALGIAERSQTLYLGGEDARVVQLQMAIPKIIASPLLGYGIGIGAYIVGFYGTNNMITLDSHLLITAVDSGLPALLLWIWFLAINSLKAIQLARTSPKPEAQWSLAISLSLACVAFFAITSPLSDLFPLAFILIGILMILRSTEGERTR